MQRQTTFIIPLIRTLSLAMAIICVLLSILQLVPLFLPELLGKMKLNLNETSINLTELREQNFSLYLMASFAGIFATSIYAMIAYFVYQLFKQLAAGEAFTNINVVLLKGIAAMYVVLWFFSVAFQVIIAPQITQKSNIEISELLVAAIIYVIATIIQQGIALKEENELTI